MICKPIPIQIRKVRKMRMALITNNRGSSRVKIRALRANYISHEAVSKNKWLQSKWIQLFIL